MFTLASEGGRPPSALVAIAVLVGVLVLALVPGQLLGRRVLFTPAGQPRFPTRLQPFAEPIVQNVTMFLLVYVGLWVWLRLSSGRPFWTLGFERERAFGRAVRGMVIAGFMIAATAGLSVIPGASRAPGLFETMGLAAVGIRLVSLVSYCVQGPAEEVLFRGWLLPVIGARYRPWIGVLASSAIFSLAHALSPGIRALGFLNLFLFGVFAAVYALAEGGLWGIGAWHAVWNWAMGDLLGFALDGSPHTGLFISIHTDGPAIISGGAFGLEGGLACTAILLSAIGTMAVRNQSRQSRSTRPDTMRA